jgi:hypothetical protein
MLRATQIAHIILPYAPTPSAILTDFLENVYTFKSAFFGDPDKTRAVLTDKFFTLPALIDSLNTSA